MNSLKDKCYLTERNGDNMKNCEWSGDHHQEGDFVIRCEKCIQAYDSYLPLMLVN